MDEDTSSEEEAANDKKPDFEKPDPVERRESIDMPMFDSDKTNGEKASVKAGETGDKQETEDKAGETGDKQETEEPTENNTEDDDTKDASAAISDDLEMTDSDDDKDDKDKDDDKTVEEKKDVETSAKTGETENDDDDLIEIEDTDDYLLYLEDILRTIHRAYYDLDDQMKASSKPTNV